MKICSYDPKSFSKYFCSFGCNPTPTDLKEKSDCRRPLLLTILYQPQRLASMGRVQNSAGATLTNPMLPLCLHRPPAHTMSSAELALCIKLWQGTMCPQFFLKHCHPSSSALQVVLSLLGELEVLQNFSLNFQFL